MRTSPNIGIDRSRGTDVGDAGDIQSLPKIAAVAQVVARANLLPEEEAISLPATAAEPLLIRLLSRLLGAKLTVDNPVWSGDPVPRMRALQKKLVEQALLLPEDDRAACLAAISLVEKAVQLRMRWQQMRKSDAEFDVKTVEDEKKS